MNKKTKALHAMFLMSSLLTAPVAYGMDCDCWNDIRLNNVRPRVEEESSECRFVYYNSSKLEDKHLKDLSNRKSLPNPIKGLHFENTFFTDEAIPDLIKIAAKLPDLKTFHITGKNQKITWRSVDRLVSEIAQQNRNGKLSIVVRGPDSGIIDCEIEGKVLRSTTWKKM